MEDIWVYVLWWIIGFGVLAGLIRSNKGGDFGTGFLIGALLGLLGVLIEAVSKPRPGRVRPELATRECPYCKSAIRRDASVCPHCQRESPPWTYHQGHWWSRNEAGDDFWLNEQTGEWQKWVPAQGTPGS